MQSGGCVRIPQKDGVVEVEEEPTRGPANQPQLPDVEQPALEEDAVGLPEDPAQAKPRPPRSRQGKHLQLMAGLQKQRLEGRQPIAAADVVRTLDEGRKAHERSSVTGKAASL
jgi:hypothetical protein